MFCLGIKTLLDTYTDTPDYSNEETKQEVTLQLNHVCIQYDRR